MKILKITLLLIVLIFATIYIALFTPIGNSLFRGLLEDNINKNIGKNGTLKEFRLTHSSYHLTYYPTPSNSVTVDGTYSLFSSSYDLLATLDLPRPSELSELANLELQERVDAEFKVSGDMHSTLVDGKLNIAGNTLPLRVELEEFYPTLITLSSNSLRIEDLLALAGAKPYAMGDLSIDVNIKDFKALDGKARITTSNALLNATLIQEDLNITIPSPSLNIEIKADLLGSHIALNSYATSALFDLKADGTITPEPLKADLTYLLDAKDLALLSGGELRGELRVGGEIKGNEADLKITALSDLASSHTNAKATLKNFTLKDLDLKAVDLSLAELLHMLGKPHYADGKLSIDAKIFDAKEKSLRGEVITTIDDGILDSSVMQNEFEFEKAPPRTIFNLNALTTLRANEALTEASIDSTLAKVTAPRILYNIHNGSLSADAKIYINALERLEFITPIKLRGSLDIDSTIKAASDLEIDATIANLGTKLKLLNDDLSLKSRSLSSTKILYMLGQNEIIDATLDADVEYNLLSQSGVAHLDLKDGSFGKNNLFDQVAKFTKVEPYKELFSGNIDANITKDIVNFDLDLSSKEVSLATTDAIIERENSLIDSTFKLQVGSSDLEAKVSGDLASPKVSIDLEEFLESEDGKKLINKANKLLDRLFR
ncbi:MAG: hypothetical protein WCR69_07030 [Sulfuricurvum sp.]